MAQAKTDISKLGLDFYYSNSDKVRILAGDTASKLYIDEVTTDTAIATIADVNGREPTIYLTPNRAVISNNSGGLGVSNTTSVELGYVHGVTSSIQTQLDGKSPTAGNANIVTVGTVSTGTWQASVIDPQYGGTGATSLSSITVGKATADSAGNIINTTYATKVELSEAISSALHFKGSVATVADLNNIVDPEVGDMYNVTATGMNYAWTGSSWDAMSTVYGIFSTTSDGLMPKVTLPSGVDPSTLVFIRSDASWVAADPSLNAGSTHNTFPSSKAVWDTMIPRNTVTTAGDMIYATGSGVITRLPLGNEGTILSSVSGIPTWVTKPASGVMSVTTGETNGTISVDTEGTVSEVSVAGLGDNAFNSTPIPTVASDIGASPAVSSSNTNSSYDILFNVNGTPSYGNVANRTLTFNPVEGILNSYNYSTNYSGDLAEDILVNKGLVTEPGYCYAYNGNLYYKTNKLSDKYFIGIHSDTAGYVLNARSPERRLRIALAGFVLAHVDKQYKSMTPLVCSKGGKLTKARLIDRILNKIVGYYWRPETHKTWGKVEVNGRHWIKIS